MDAGTAVAMLTLDIGGFTGGLTSALTAAESVFSSMSATAAQKTQALGASLATTGNLLTQTVSRPIATVSQDVFKVGSAFEKTMDTVAAVSQKPGQSLIELQNNTDRLREKALELGSSTFFSANEVADGMVIMGKAGWDTQNILDGMGGVLDAAAASGEDLSTVSDVVVNSLTAFGLEAGQASNMADLLTQSANSGTHDIVDLGNSLKYAGPVAKALGMDVVDVTSALTMMSTAGIRGSQAGTSLRRILLNMVSPTEKQAAAMQKLGLSAVDSNGKFKSLDQIFRELRANVNELGGSEIPEVQAALQDFAGAYGISGLNAILNITDEQFNQISHDMAYSGGVAKDTAAIMRDNVAGAWDEFTDKIETAKVKIFDAIAPSLKNLLDNLNNFMDGLLNNFTPKMGKFIAGLAGVVAAIGPAMSAFGILASIDSRLNGPITHVVGMVSDLGGSFKTLAPKVSNAIKPFGAVMGSLKNNIGNIIPITRAAVKGASGNFASMVKDFSSKTKEIGNIPNRLGRSFQAFKRIATDSFRSPLEYMRSIGKDTSTTMELIEGRVASLKPTFKSTFSTLSTTAKSAWGKVTEGLSKANFQNKVFLGQIGEGWRRTFSGGGPILQAIGNFGKSFAKGFARLPENTVKTAGSIVSTFKKVLSKPVFEGVGGNIAKGLSTAFNSVKGAVTSSANFIKTSYADSFKYMAEGFKLHFPNFSKGVETFSKSVSNAWKNAGKYAVQEMKGIVPGLKTVFSGAWDQLTTTLGPKIPQIKGLFSEIAGGLSNTFGPAFNTVSSIGTKTFSLIGSAGKLAFGGTIVAAIALCIAAFVHLMRNNEDFANGVKKVGEQVGEAFNKIGFVLGQVASYLKPVFDTIKQLFDEFATQAAPLFLQIFQGIADGLTNFANSLSTNLQGPLDGVKWLLQSLTPVFQGVFMTALGLLRMVAGFVSGDFKTAWDGVKQVIDGFSQVLTGLASTADGLVKGALQGIADKLRDLGLDAAADAVEKASEKFSLFSDVLNTVREKISEWGAKLSEIFSQVAQKASELGEKMKPALDTIIPILVNIAAIVGGVFMAAWSAAFSTIGNIVVRVIGTIAGVLGGIGNVIVGIANIVAGVWNVISNVVLAIVSLITGDLQGAADHMGQAFDGAKQVVDGALGAMGGAVEAFASAVSGAFGFVGDIIGGAGEFIGGTIDNVVGWFTGAGDSAGQMADKTGTAMGSFSEHVASAERSAKALAGGAGDAMAEMGLSAEDMSQKAGGSFNELAGSSEDASSRIRLTTDEAKANIAQFALESGMSVEELAQATGVAAEDISAAIDGIPTSADGAFGDLSSILGDSGLDWSQYANGLGADTGVATASFEEMGAAIDKLATDSTQAATTVSQSFQTVSGGITESVNNITNGFTQLGTHLTQTFSNAATQVTTFTTNASQQLNGFGLNVVNAFTAMNIGITQSFSSLGATVSSALNNVSGVIAIWAATSLNTIMQAFNSFVMQVGQVFSQVQQVIGTAMGAAVNSVNQFGMATQAAVQAANALNMAFISMAMTVTNACVQMLSSVASFAGNMNSTFAAMCSTLMATVNAGFTSIAAIVRAQTAVMLAAVTQFGARLVSTMTSTMSRCRSVVQSGMTSMNSTMRTQLNQMTSAVTQFGTRAASAMKTAMTQMLASVKSGCQQTTSELQRSTSQWLQAISRFAGEARSRAQAAGQGIKSGLIGALNGLYSQMYSLGLQAANGMASGIRAGAGGVISAMQSIANAAVAAAKNSLKVASPSKVMRDEVGYWLPAGIAQGINENSGVVSNAMVDLAKNLIALSQDTARDWTEESKKQLDTFGEAIKKGITNVTDRLRSTWTDYFEQQLKENTDAQNTAYREMARIENEYHKRLEQAKDKNAKDALIADRDRLLTAQEERISTLQKQREEIQKQYDETQKDVAKFGTDVLDKFGEAMNKVADEASAEITEKFQKISEAAKEALEEVNKKIESMTSKLQDYGDLLTKQHDEETGDYWQLNSLKEQINALEKYGNNLEAIKGKVSETLLSEIVAMDVEQATHYTDLLLSMTDKKLSEYNALYERKQQLAADIANKFYADQVQQVKDNYLKELVNAYLETFDQISEIGKDTAAAFMESFDMDEFSDEYKAFAAQFERGIQESFGDGSIFKNLTENMSGDLSTALTDTFDEATRVIVAKLFGLNEEVANAVDLEPVGAEAGSEFGHALYVQAKEELGIHSPSTVFKSLGEDTGQGFIDGIMAVLTSGDPFRLFADAMSQALTDFTGSLETGAMEQVYPAVESIVNKVGETVTGLLAKLRSDLTVFFSDVRSWLTELASFIDGTVERFVSASARVASAYAQMAAAARDTAAAAREAKAAVEALAAAQSAAAEVSANYGSGGSGVPVSNVTNNYTTTINSPVKVSAVEAMQSAKRSMRSLAEGF